MPLATIRNSTTAACSPRQKEPRRQAFAPTKTRSAQPLTTRDTPFKWNKIYWGNTNIQIAKALFHFNQSNSHLSASRTLEKHIVSGYKDRYLGGCRFRTWFYTLATQYYAYCDPLINAANFRIHGLPRHKHERHHATRYLRDIPRSKS